MRRLSCTFAFVLAFACATEAGTKTELLKTSAGSPAHWMRTDISVGLDRSAASRSLSSEEVGPAIERATLVWNRVAAGQPRLHYVAEGMADVALRFCRGQWHGDGIDLGHTQFSASLRDGSVTAAIIELNECDHAFAVPGKPSPDHLDLQAVVTHELGHALGLGHSNDPNSVMYPSGTGAGASRPHQADETALALLYFGRTLETSASDSNVANEQPVHGTSSTISSASGGTTLRAALKQAGAQRSPQDAHNAAPTNSVSVLNLKTHEGREVMVYTCEPTILPPITAAPLDKEPKGLAAQRSRTRARQR